MRPSKCWMLLSWSSCGRGNSTSQSKDLMHVWMWSDLHQDSSSKTNTMFFLNLVFLSLLLTIHSAGGKSGPLVDSVHIPMWAYAGRPSFTCSNSNNFKQEHSVILDQTCKPFRRNFMTIPLSGTDSAQRHLEDIWCNNFFYIISTQLRPPQKAAFLCWIHLLPPSRTEDSHLSIRLIFSTVAHHCHDNVKDNYNQREQARKAQRKNSVLFVSQCLLAFLSA